MQCSTCRDQMRRDAGVYVCDTCSATAPATRDADICQLDFCRHARSSHSEQPNVGAGVEALEGPPYMCADCAAIEPNNDRWDHAFASFADLSPDQQMRELAERGKTAALPGLGASE